MRSSKRVPAAPSPVSDLTARPPNAPPDLSSTMRLVLLASCSAMFLATSSAPTPLYPAYSAAWGLSAAGTSLVFGVYALVLLASLLVAGRLSDHWGRRPVIWGALLVQVVAMIVFATASGLVGLLAGRVLQGVSTGVGLAAVGSALLDVDTERGTAANSIAPPAGSAAGALGSALLVQFAPNPLKSIYIVLAVVLVAQLGAVRWLPETSPCRKGALASLRPHVAVPLGARPLLLAALPVLFAVWALSGLFGALGPDLTEQLTGSTSAVLGALPIAIVGAVSPLAALAATRLTPRGSLGRGVTALVVGVAITACAVLASEILLLLAGAVVAGVGFGLGFRGGMQLVLPQVDVTERSGTLSLLYLASYLGFGAPAIVAGIVADQTGDLQATTLGYAIMLILLALVAAAALAATRRDAGALNVQQPQGSSP
jgi:MFS family permease